MSIQQRLLKLHQNDGRMRACQQFSFHPEPRLWNKQTTIFCRPDKYSIVKQTRKDQMQFNEAPIDDSQSKSNQITNPCSISIHSHFAPINLLNVSNSTEQTNNNIESL
jgi:hypothetical protein